MTMMRNFKCDFHMHSKYSIDGEYSIEELLALANSKQLTHIALCDHNCMLGIDELLDKASKYDIKAVAAIEFDSLFHGRETHIVGYHLDYKQEEFLHLHEEINALEFNAFAQKIDRLMECYHIPLDKDSLLERCHSENPFQVIYGSFLAHPKAKSHPDLQPYLKGGSRSENAIVNFYWDACSYGKEAFVPIAYPSAREVIAKIHKANGIAILAHPGIHYYQQSKLLNALMEEGIDGIEAYSSYHDAQQNEYFTQYCLSNDLLISGGSDFHGSYKPDIILGEYGLQNKDLLIPFMEKLHL